MLILRKILFYIFAGIYIVLCPLLILYALGYIYEPGSKNGLVKTGLIYIATIPPNATISLNGNEIEERSPTTIQELLPGEYKLRIALDGYKGWEQTVPVMAEKATVLDSIIMIPESWQFKEVLELPVQNIMTLPGLNVILLVKGRSVGELDVLNIGSGKVYKMRDLMPGFEGAAHNAFYSVTGSSAFIMQMRHEGQEKFLWIDIEGGVPQTKDISQLFPDIPRHIVWDPGNEDIVFACQSGQVNKLDIKEGAMVPGYLAGIKGFGAGGGKVYAIKDDDTLEQMSYDKSSETVLLKDKKIGQQVFSAEGFTSIRPFVDEILLFLGPDGSLGANRLPYDFVDKGVIGIKPLPEQKQVLVLKKDRVGILDFTGEKTGNVGFEQGPSLKWICRGGEDIKQAFWVYKGSHVLVQDGGKIALHEIEDYGKVKIDELFEVRRGTNIYYSDGGGDLYFVDKATGRLKMTEIIPGTGTIQESFDKMQKELKKEKLGEVEKTLAGEKE